MNWLYHSLPQESDVADVEAQAPDWAAETGQGQGESHHGSLHGWGRANEAGWRSIFEASVRRCTASLASLSAGMQSRESQPGCGALNPKLLSREQLTLSRSLRMPQELWGTASRIPSPGRHGREHGQGGRDHQSSDPAGSGDVSQAALDGPARQEMAHRPCQAMDGEDAVGGKEGPSKGKADCHRDTNWR